MSSKNRRAVGTGTTALKCFGQAFYSRNSVNFQDIKAAALAALPDLLATWLPDGKRCGGEWTAKNPRRADHHAGSFSVNLRTGRWADFATCDARGGDAVSLCAYLHGLSQVEAARKLAMELGVNHG